MTPATLSEAELDGMVGQYAAEVSPTFTLHFSVKRDGRALVLESDAISKQALIPESGTSFVLGDSGSRLPVVRDSAGKVMSLRAFGVEVKRVR